jgi:serine-type D-Ala-D-Ala endopeptidase (penicillin-binding protein 7)
MRKNKISIVRLLQALSLAVLAAAAGLLAWGLWAPDRGTVLHRADRTAAAPVARTPVPPAEPPGPVAPLTSEPPAGPTEPQPPLVEAPSGEDSQAEPTRPTLSEGRQAGLHRARDGLGLNSSVALVMDVQSGQVLFEKNEQAVLPIASLTKLMTALIVLDSRMPLQETIAITGDDVDRVKNSRSRLAVGTKLARAHALQLALMSSENRAAHALGRTYPGGIDAFVAAMNVKARELGMKDTNFVDPTGLSPQNRSTARDVALLTRVAAGQPMLREFSTVERAQLTTARRTLVYTNSNPLVKSPAWDIQLQKTGYIVEAGQCVAMLVEVQQRPLVMVLLDAGDQRGRRADAERLRGWVARQGANDRHATGTHPQPGKS